MYKISVIIPVYNSAKYLEECLNSIVSQTLSGIEILCINDGSTDKSAQILEKYRKKYASITIITIEHSGLSIARNIGVDHATGKYIGFLDSDDIVSSDFYYQLYSLAEQNSCQIAVGPVVILDSDTIIKNNFISRLHKKIQKTLFCDLRSKRLLILTCVVWNKIFLRSFYRKNKVSFPPELYWEDNFVNFKLIIHASKIAIAHSGRYYWRKHTDSMSNNFKMDKKSFDIFRILLAIQAECTIEHDTDTSRYWHLFFPYLEYIQLTSRFAAIKNEYVKIIFYKKMRQLFFKRYLFTKPNPFFSEGEVNYIQSIIANNYLFFTLKRYIGQFI